MNTFPIYQIKIRFDRDIASHHKMFRNHPTQQEMNEAVDKAIANTLDSHPDYKVESISVKYLGEETWCRTWFSHYTYNTGTDKEILDSFRDYVYRALRGKVPWIENRDQLMGADEEWRWKGHKILDDGSVVLVDPPCHCKYCRENGWIFIVH